MGVLSQATSDGVDCAARFRAEDLSDWRNCWHVLVPPVPRKYPRSTFTPYRDLHDPLLQHPTQIKSCPNRRIPSIIHIPQLRQARGFGYAVFCTGTLIGMYLHSLTFTNPIDFPFERNMFRIGSC